MIKWFAWTLLASSYLLSQSHYELFIDPHASPFMGSEDMLTLHSSLEQREEGILPPKDPPARGLLPGLGRWMELTLFWDPLNSFTDVVQHEVFGHGYRIRSMHHGKVTGYSFGWPFPYGAGGGATNWNASLQIRVGEIQAVDVAGLEAENILARNLKCKWMAQGRIDPRAASMYNAAQLSPLLYALASSFPSVSDPETYDLMDGNDILAYLAGLNLLYPQESFFGLHQLKSKLLYNLCDPMIYYAFAAQMYYIFSGKSLPLAMICIGNLKWLPNLSVQLAPYGLEYYVENYFVYNTTPVYTYVKAGRHADLEYFGLGIHYNEMLSHDNMSIGLRFDSWYQPNFLVAWTLQELMDGVRPLDTYLDSLERKWGASLSCVSRWRIHDTLTFFYSDLGYKTRGYLPGFPLQASPIVRLGISASF